MNTPRRTAWALRINRIDAVARLAMWALIVVMTIVQHARSRAGQASRPQVTAPQAPPGPASDAVAVTGHS